MENIDALVEGLLDAVALVNDGSYYRKDDLPRARILLKTKAQDVRAAFDKFEGLGCNEQDDAKPKD